MTHPYLADERVAAYLYEYTDAMLTDAPNTSALASKHEISIREAEAYNNMLQYLNATLVEVKPSRQFKRDLRADLLGEAQTSPFGRLRNLPPRLRFAAGVALLAAMALIGRRRLFVEVTKLLSPLENGQPPQDSNHPEAKISTS